MSWRESSRKQFDSRVARNWGAASASEYRPDLLYESRELRQRVAHALASLAQREQRIVLLTYSHELTQKQISILLGISPSRVGQLHRRALRKLATGLSPSHPSKSIYFRNGELCLPRSRA